MCGLGYRLWWNRRSLCWRKARLGTERRSWCGKEPYQKTLVVAFHGPDDCRKAASINFSTSSSVR